MVSHAPDKQQEGGRAVVDNFGRTLRRSSIGSMSKGVSQDSSVRGLSHCTMDRAYFSTILGTSCVRRRYPGYIPRIFSGSEEVGFRSFCLEICAEAFSYILPP